MRKKGPAGRTLQFSQPPARAVSPRHTVDLGDGAAGVGGVDDPEGRDHPLERAGGVWDRRGVGDGDRIHVGPHGGGRRRCGAVAGSDVEYPLPGSQVAAARELLRGRPYPVVEAVEFAPVRPGPLLWLAAGMGICATAYGRQPAREQVAPVAPGRP
ncbi:MAG TPA: hypothetical protein VG126_12065 [Thermoleophilaceae bacterium]|nr:hypothetical protein [Thermoleophilaceae bacterium]